jgi:hypothetical protein
MYTRGNAHNYTRTHASYARTYALHTYTHVHTQSQTGESGTPGTLSEDTERWVVGSNQEDAQALAAARYPGSTFTLCQDEDVLDTWCVLHTAVVLV